jgi:protein PhnA
MARNPNEYNYESDSYSDDEKEVEPKVVDSNGTELKDGDQAVLIKSLKLKGSAITLKQGAVAKKISLTDNIEEVDCKVDNMRVVLRTEFLRKS